MEMLFNEFVEVSPNKVITIPFVLDNVDELVIEVGRFGDEIQVRLETRSGEIVEPDEIQLMRLVFSRKKIKIGDYKLILTSSDSVCVFDSKIKIKVKSDLQMETIIISSTPNSDKHGLIQVRLYYKDYNTPIENAIVSVGDHLFTYIGNGIYTSTFPNGFANEFVLLNIYAIGYFNGVAFQRHFGGVAKGFSGWLVFSGPFDWKITYDGNNPKIVTSIVLNIGVEVKKSDNYGIYAHITDITNEEHRGRIENEWITESDEKKIHKPTAASGNSWKLEPGYYNLELDFDVSEVLVCGAGPYRLNILAGCPYNDEDHTCDAIMDSSDFPLLVL